MQQGNNNKGGIPSWRWGNVTAPDKTAHGTPLVSVVTIVKNGADVLERTIQSVAGQSYPEYEYVVIDGGSSDGSLNIIKSYEKAITSWTSEPDRGIGDAFNKGVARSRGEWIIFMNAGDSFVDSHVLQKFSEVLRESGRFDIIHGDVQQVDKFGKCIRTVGGPLNRRKFKFHMSVPHQAIFHNRAFFDRYGLFDTSLKMAMDYELLTRKKDLQVLHVAAPVAATLVGGVSQQNYRKLILEMRSIRERNIGPSTLLSDGRYFLTYAKVSVVLLLRRVFGEQFI
jgi:glycosyltransferase involved in cell wall biosynthesis